MAAINLVVASGRIGREGCGYAMITGQGNGQCPREQGTFGPNGGTRPQQL